MADAVRFGNYTFPVTLLPQGASSGQNLSAQTRRRASGSITQVGKRDVTLLPIRGDLYAASPDDLKSLVSQIKAAVYTGKQPLWYGDDDWYYRDVQLETEAFPRGAEGRGPWYAVSLTFKASDYPEQYKTSATTWTFPPGGGTVTVEGDAPTQPLWTITIGNAGTGALTLLNAASGETAVLDPGGGGWAAGDVIRMPFLVCLVASIAGPILLERYKQQKAKKTPEQELDEDEKARLGNLRDDIKSCRDTVTDLESQIATLRKELSSHDRLLRDYWNHYAGCAQLREEHAKDMQK